jgi:CarD family transcriptional regulator, regulator of rRNA transcription
MAAKATKKTKTSAKKSSAKTTTKTKAASKKTTAKKSAPTKPKKAAAKAGKPAAKTKAAAKKTASKKAATKTASKTKAAAKKTATKKAAVKKTTTKAATKKTATKAAPKRAAAKAAPKAATKKAATKKAATKKATKASKAAALTDAPKVKPTPRKVPIIARPQRPERIDPIANKPPTKNVPKETATPAPRPTKLEFKPKEFVVYPAHGVGKITSVEKQEVAGHELELYVITFEKDKMTLRVPTNKSEAVGLRKLSEPKVVAEAINTLKGKAKVKRTMWSRRAQEYEAKINSGDLIFIAEVVRDLYRSDKQPEQSYSERQLYEAAIDRMAREVAAAENLDDVASIGKLESVLVTAAGKAEKKAEEAAAASEAENAS